MILDRGGLGIFFDKWVWESINSFLTGKARRFYDVYKKHICVFVMSEYIYICHITFIVSTILYT